MSAFTGAVQGQVVGFDTDGNPVAQEAPKGGVTSFKGRTGAVTPQSDDYSVSQVTGAAPTASPAFTGSISMSRKSGVTVGSRSVAVGYDVTASAQMAHAEGWLTVASGDAAHAEGLRTTASGKYSHAEGSDTKAQMEDAHAEGSGTTASNYSTHAEGYKTEASGMYAHAEGGNTIASGNNAHAEGGFTEARGQDSHAGGTGTIANDFQYVIGTYNVEKSNSTSSSGDRFIVGGGRFSARKNAFRVNFSGACYGSGAWNSSGADYAELFEWQDGNPDSEDRAGLFVTLDGEHIRIARPDDDYILGIVSATPLVVGDVYDDQWQGMEVRDVFGRTVMEMRDIPAEIGPNGEEITPARRELAPKLNPDYDHTLKYQPRTQRPKWDAVGLLGKLVAVDDGTCQVNGWATVGVGGVATTSPERTKYRIMARLDGTHVRVMIL